MNNNQRGANQARVLFSLLDINRGTSPAHFTPDLSLQFEFIPYTEWQDKTTKRNEARMCQWEKKQGTSLKNNDKKLRRRGSNYNWTVSATFFRFQLQPALAIQIRGWRTALVSQLNMYSLIFSSEWRFNHLSLAIEEGERKEIQENNWEFSRQTAPKKKGKQLLSLLSSSWCTLNLSLLMWCFLQ